MWPAASSLSLSWIRHAALSVFPPSEAHSATPHDHKDFSAPKGSRNCPANPPRSLEEEGDARKAESPKIKPTSSTSAPTWTPSQLGEAVFSVVTQRMRFTQAASRYGIPKGTLYDNILGKSRRMRAIDEMGLTAEQEARVLEFCCSVDLSSPAVAYNRRTARSLREVLAFVGRLTGGRTARTSVKRGFRWWWAFCKKHSVISLHYDDLGINGRKETMPYDHDKIDLERDTLEDLIRRGRGSAG